MVAMQLAVALVMYSRRDGERFTLCGHQCAVGSGVARFGATPPAGERAEATADALPYLATAVGVMGSILECGTMAALARALVVAMGAALYPAVLWSWWIEMLRESALYLFKKKKRPRP